MNCVIYILGLFLIFLTLNEFHSTLQNVPVLYSWNWSFCTGFCFSVVVRMLLSHTGSARLGHCSVVGSIRTEQLFLTWRRAKYEGLISGCWMWQSKGLFIYTPMSQGPSLSLLRDGHKQAWTDVHESDHVQRNVSFAGRTPPDSLTANAEAEGQRSSSRVNQTSPSPSSAPLGQTSADEKQLVVIEFSAAKSNTLLL